MPRISRTEQMQQTAFELGMTYQAKDDWGILKLLKDFHLFRRGGRKRIEHVLYRRDDMLETEVNIFDYAYTISSGKSSQTYRQTVFFVQSKKLGLPQFLMKPEHFFHKVGEWLGMVKDIDFEAFPQFSDQYWLRSEDEEYMRATAHEPFLKFFSIEKNWHLEGVNYFLILYRDNQLLTPPQIRDFHKKGMKVCEMLHADQL